MYVNNCGYSTEEGVVLGAEEGQDTFRHTNHEWDTKQLFQVLALLYVFFLCLMVDKCINVQLIVKL